MQSKFPILSVHSSIGAFFSKLLSIHYKTGVLLTKLTPFFNLAIRLYLAVLLINRGVSAVRNWEGTVFLYENEYKLALLSGYAWANIYAFSYIVLAGFLALGVATRYSSVILLFLVSFMSTSYQYTQENYFLMLCSILLLVNGASKISLDFLFKKYLRPKMFCAKCESETSS